MSDQPLATTALVQIGIVVQDIEAKIQGWAEVFGLPVPPISISDAIDTAHTEYHGRPSEARVKQAFFQMGQVQVELMEPIGAPSTWREHLDQHGESIHHIAFRVAGMQNTLAYLAAKEIPLIQRGDYTGGRYAYADSVKKLGLILELLEND